MIRIAITLSLAAALAACSSGPRQTMPDRMINRILAGAPGQAQPGKIVAREIAFARMAREEGQWTAFRAFAGSGAVLHGPDGPIAAGPWLMGRADPPEAVQWDPRTIWMSCDGSLAVSQGRFRDPQGQVGTFITVWKARQDGEYEWVYDVGTPDDPQPPKPVPLEQGDIVVTAIDAVRAEIADCPGRGAEVPAAPAFSIAEEFNHGGDVSRDGTLRWRWEHRQPRQRRLVVDYFQNGSWVTGLDQDLSAAVPAGDAE